MQLVVTGTGTGVGKTVISAAVCASAAAQGLRVAYLKAAQTGVPGDEPDVDVVRRLAGPDVVVAEGARYPDPMSPEAAARRSGLPAPELATLVALACELAASHDLTVIEGAGGLLVRFAADGWTLAELAHALAAPLLVVAGPQLGTLNATALTLEVMAGRGLTCAALVVGSWPVDPGPLERSNAEDLRRLGGPIPILFPEAAGGMGRSEFAGLSEAVLGSLVSDLIAGPGR